MATRNGGAFVLVALCVSGLALRVAGAGEPLMPAMYVLGDSTVDVGNNNFLPDCSAECRANYPRYGVDFPTHKPTGRFSNGYNLADQIAQFIGFTESPPAYASLPPEKILEQMKTGINFASGGSGLQDQTGKHCGRVYTMTDQLEKFTCAVQMMGNSSYDLISRSLVFISVGSNDLFEYVDGNATLSPSRNDTAFLEGLVGTYKCYLQELYAVGARKFSIVSPSMVGCCPTQRYAGATKKDLDGYRCFGTANDLSRQLYTKLHSMLQDLSVDLAGMNYSICDSAAMAETVLKHAASPTLNLTVLDTGCCGGAGLSGDGKCTMFASVCPNRDNYLFWDGFHPTQAASAEAAFALVADQGLYVHPINITRLAAL
jgi:phospholipase/lecithinase/hemolysin